MIYGNAQAAGMSPAEVDRSSLWQVTAAVEGWRKAHTRAEDDDGLTASEFAGLGALARLPSMVN